MNLAQKIASYIKASGRKQIEFAQSIGVSQAQLSSWITSERDPWGMRLRTAKQLAKEMNTTLDALARDDT